MAQGDMAKDEPPITLRPGQAFIGVASFSRDIPNGWRPAAARLRSPPIRPGGWSLWAARRMVGRPPGRNGPLPAPWASASAPICGRCIWRPSVRSIALTIFCGPARSISAGRMRSLCRGSVGSPAIWMPMTSARWQARLPGGLLGCGDPTLSDHQGAVQAAASANDRDGVQPSQDGGAGLGSARPHHSVQVSENIGRPDSLPERRWPPEPAGRHRAMGTPLVRVTMPKGIKFLGDGEWQARKPGVQGRRARHCRSDPRRDKARGARSIRPRTLPLRTFGRWNFPIAAMATALFCRSCSTRYRTARRSAP